MRARLLQPTLTGQRSDTTSTGWLVVPRRDARRATLAVPDRLMRLDNLTWFVNDPGRDASRR